MYNNFFSVLQEILKRQFMDSETEIRADKRQYDDRDRIYPHSLKQEDTFNTLSTSQRLHTNRNGDSFRNLNDDGSVDYLPHLGYQFENTYDDERRHSIPSALDENTSRVLYNHPIAVADPPPLDIRELKAEVLEYPKFELLSPANGYMSEKKRTDSMFPPKQYNDFVYRKRRRR